MNRAAILLVSLVLLTPKSWAEVTKAPETLAVYLEALQVKLDHAAQRANQPTSGGSNVIGLRGAKQEPLSKQLYWKGKSGTAAASTDELKLFRGAIDEARAGKNDAAVSGLKSFLEKYPRSALKPEAEETLSRLTAVKP